MKEDYVLKKMKQLLKERNWTRYQLAKESGINYSTLTNIFRHNRMPSVSTLLRICDGFGITLSEFFDEGTGTVNQLTAADQKLLSDFHCLMKNDKNLVTACINSKYSQRLRTFK